MKLPELGAKITVKATVDKSKNWHKAGHITIFRSQALDEPIEGVFIGKRIVSTGYTEHDYDQWINSYWPNEHREAWLVVTSPYKNPIYAFPEDCEIQTDEET